ncbi:unnamed protein product [Vitrella brassicaformis CCMP3155]|uniref:Uncharacterized protein n=2 Tax=Vitrella brassicaformis TaxID=1169539 RepID=A0A0G4EST9_VITBC|nr:unnamed protein product [Vitrella brassicaformis CCMP3155]|eukprot:CEM00950.1 unnamed protein product [Vitrella brassicaformis CCMP3155]
MISSVVFIALLGLQATLAQVAVEGTSRDAVVRTHEDKKDQQVVSSSFVQGGHHNILRGRESNTNTHTAEGRADAPPPPAAAGSTYADSYSDHLAEAEDREEEDDDPIVELMQIHESHHTTQDNTDGIVADGAAERPPQNKAEPLPHQPFPLQQNASTVPALAPIKISDGGHTKPNQQVAAASFAEEGRNILRRETTNTHTEASGDDYSERLEEDVELMQLDEGHHTAHAHNNTHNSTQTRTHEGEVGAVAGEMEGYKEALLLEEDNDDDPISLMQVDEAHHTAHTHTSGMESADEFDSYFAEPPQQHADEGHAEHSCGEGEGCMAGCGDTDKDGCKCSPRVKIEFEKDYFLTQTFERLNFPSTTLCMADSVSVGPKCNTTKCNTPKSTNTKLQGTAGCHTATTTTATSAKSTQRSAMPTYAWRHPAARSEPYAVHHQHQHQHQPQRQAQQHDHRYYSYQFSDPTNKFHILGRRSSFGPAPAAHSLAQLNTAANSDNSAEAEADSEAEGASDQTPLYAERIDLYSEKLDADGYTVAHLRLLPPASGQSSSSSFCEGGVGGGVGGVGGGVTRRCAYHDNRSGRLGMIPPSSSPSIPPKSIGSSSVPTKTPTLTVCRAPPGDEWRDVDFFRVRFTCLKPKHKQITAPAPTSTSAHTDMQNAQQSSFIPPSTTTTTMAPWSAAGVMTTMAPLPQQPQQPQQPTPTPTSIPTTMSPMKMKLLKKTTTTTTTTTTMAPMAPAGANATIHGEIPQMAPLKMKTETEEYYYTIR